LGQRHAQLLVSIACTVPFFCSQLGQLEPDSELLEGLLDCMQALAGACGAHGFAGLGDKLQLFAQALNVNSSSSSSFHNVAAAEHGGSNSSSREQHETQLGGQQQQQRQVHFSPPRPGMQQPGHRPTHSMAGGMGDSGGFASGTRPQQQQKQPGQLPGHVSHSLLQLMRPLCLQLSCALLPTFADWLLRFWVGLLLLPGAGQMHPHVLLLLKCLFGTPGLQLGPASALLLDSSFLSPLVALAQVRRNDRMLVRCSCHHPQQAHVLVQQGMHVRPELVAGTCSGEGGMSTNVHITQNWQQMWPACCGVFAL
jgi:hypothetical protein